MFRPEVCLRFRGDDADETVFVGASGDEELAREVAGQLLAEAEAAVEIAPSDDSALVGLLNAEAARLRAVLASLHGVPLTLAPR